ncbi:MAG: excinuclease ABC subunit UvrC [Alphaproteobacteria bacterium]|nr:excinuclease ABC subunit UvrC [Alphaproteobacteria bacterium]
MPGMAAIAAALATLPGAPGVYRMLSAEGEVLYVGKAKNLKRRVASYTQAARLGNRIRRMVMQTASLEIVTTHTEVEALLLEANLIKRLKPRFNVILRDDKSFPYILVTADHEWPQIAKHRGARNRKGSYFGPFASAGAVNRTLATLQRAFPLRSCSDADFATRTRPCLQYQIKRCTAPCVGRIDRASYGQIVADVEAFLSGESQKVQAQLSRRMEEAAAGMDFETAAIWRDRIRALAQITAHQDINVEGVGEADVIALASEGGMACVQVFFFRAGQNFGNRAYFPAHAAEVEPGEVLAAFIGQFYDARPAPRQILTSHAVTQAELLAEALAVGAGRKVEILRPQRGAKRNLVEHAQSNAREALARRLAENATQRHLLESLAGLFGLEGMPERIEVYDNSHIQGTHPVGAMIVAGPDGFVKGAYRKFHMREPEGGTGDDYAMLREMLRRRFRRMAEGGDREAPPDLILIDGGKGQLGVACEVLAELGISGVSAAAIAKGPDRNAGRERFFLPGREPFSLEPRDPVLYFLQRLRDEAHRFAIGSHRERRSRAIGGSPLDEIPGVGPKRKRALLLHFGSARAVAAAGLADLEKVEGVSREMARAIYDHFHAG